jgi:hypothetical protein
VTIGGLGDFQSTGEGYGGIHLYMTSGTNKSFHFWGAGMEEAVFATSTTVAATPGFPATRDESTLRYPGGANVADGPGPRTYVTRLLIESGRSGYVWSISDGGASTDRIYLTIEASSGVARVRTAISAGDAGNVTGTTDLMDGVEHEVRVLLGHNHLRLIVDGAEEGTRDTAVDIPQGLDRWDVGHDEADANHLNGMISELRCYKGLVL